MVAQTQPAAASSSTPVNIADPDVFGRTDKAVEGWYWALRSADLAKGKVTALNFLGRELALYRGHDGNVRAVDAYCPHMGAHLAEGMVEGDNLRCFFHGWTYEPDGTLTSIPCQNKPLDLRIQTWPVKERYGLIWIYNGREPTHDVFEVPELAGQEVDWGHGAAFEKGCHPNIVMVNAIDEQHFTTVHNLPVKLHFDVQERTPQLITFDNTTHIPMSNPFLRFLGRFYAGPLTYKMAYQTGSTGSVTVGPDFLHFHIIFCLRPTSDGKALGQTVLITDRRRGPVGWLVNRVLLFLTKLVGDYFAHGDTKIFQTIKWKFKHPIAADRSIIRFIKHLERMATVTWEEWSVERKLVPLRRKPRQEDASFDEPTLNPFDEKTKAGPHVAGSSFESARNFEDAVSFEQGETRADTEGNFEESTDTEGVTPWPA